MIASPMRSSVMSVERNRVSFLTIKIRHVAVISILLAEIIILIWWFQYLPMTDLPEHILAARVLTHYDAAGSEYPTFFTKHFPWAPYSSYFLFVLITEPLLGVQNATRLYLSLAFILTTIGLWSWIRVAAPGRDAQVIPATLLLFGYFFYVGLINFIFSAPFVFLSLALSWKLLETEHVRTRMGIGLATSILLAYLSHIATFGFTGIVVLGQALLCFRNRIRRLVLPFAPTLVLLSVYTLVEGNTDVTSTAVSWDPFIDRAATLLLPFNIFFDSLVDRWVFDWPFIIIWICALGIMFVGRAIRRVSEPSAARLAVATTLILLGCTLFLPSSISVGLGVALRGSYFLAFAALVLLPADWDEHSVLRALMIMICALSPVLIASRSITLGTEMKDLERVIDRIPPARVIQPIITEPHVAGFRTYPLQHAPAWYSYYKGGVNPYLMAGWAGHFPIRIRQQFVPVVPAEWQMHLFRYETHQLGTDYFLVRTHDDKILDDLREHVPLAAVEGEWQLFGPNPRQ
jgi:hypothetical protein